MTIWRYSAIKMFGVPIDYSPELKDKDALLNLMDDYQVVGEDISRRPTDITPYYWEKSSFKYILSQSDPEGPAIVEFIPRFEKSRAHILIGGLASKQLITMPMNTLKLEIPTNQEMMAIVGSSPRFAGQLCIHELIAKIEQ